MRRVLFVINTMGRAGAENSFLNLLYGMPEDMEIDLLVLTGQGEMTGDIPERVRILNKKTDPTPVNSEKGRKVLKKTVLKALFLKGGIFKDGGYICRNYRSMKKEGQVKWDKLLWRVLSDTAPATDRQYDLAVAFIEGGAAYYVADRVEAVKKAAFIHVDYAMAGYNTALDLDSYLSFDKVFCVSEEVRAGFIKVHPEMYRYTDIFKNILNVGLIRKRAEETPECTGKASAFFDPSYKGTRLLTVGRLTRQKNWEKSILAAGLLRQKKMDFIWLLLGDGEERRVLSEKIKAAGVEDCFIMAGAVDNPYPYIKRADIYVHCSAYEGKSVAIQEAKILGKPLIISDVPGNREQVENNKNGLLVHFKSNRIADGILSLQGSPEKMEAFALANKKEAEEAFGKDSTGVEKLLKMIEMPVIKDRINTETAE